VGVDTHRSGEVPSGLRGGGASEGFTGAGERGGATRWQVGPTSTGGWFSVMSNKQPEGRCVAL